MAQAAPLFILIAFGLAGVLIGLAQMSSQRSCPYCRLQVSRRASRCPHCRSYLH